MSGLSPSSIDLAISSKRQIARVLKSLHPFNKFAIAIGSGIVVIGKEVNPTLGNNLQMEWDTLNTRVIIHNDFPVYSGGNYYYIDVLTPATDKYISLSTLVDSTTPYNHFFLVDSGNPNIGNIEIVVTANENEPVPVGTKLIYIGYAYRGINDEIVIVNIGRLIDLAYLIKDVSYVDYLDEYLDKVSPLQTNILRFMGFFGPGITKVVTEVIIFIKDDLSALKGFAYSPVTSHSLTPTENLRITWKVTI